VDLVTTNWTFHDTACP